MTAAIYFGEMLVASLLAIVLLAVSQLGMSSEVGLFVGGVVTLTLAEYACIVLRCMVSHQSNTGYIMPILTVRSSRFFGKYGFVSRWSI